MFSLDQHGVPGLKCLHLCRLTAPRCPGLGPPGGEGISTEEGALLPSLGFCFMEII